MKNTIRTLSFVGLIAGLATSAQAANLIVDGSFEGSKLNDTITSAAGDYVYSDHLNAGWVGAGWTFTAGDEANMTGTKWLGQAVEIDTTGTGLELSFDWTPTTGNPATVDFLLRGRSGVNLTGTEGQRRIFNLGNGKASNAGSGTRFDFVSGGTFSSGDLNAYTATGVVGSTTNITVQLPISGVTDLSQLNYLELAFKSNGANEGTLDNVVLTAVPEPSSYALLAGCFGLTWVMLRRRR